MRMAFAVAGLLTSSVLAAQMPVVRTGAAAPAFTVADDQGTKRSRIVF